MQLRVGRLAVRRSSERELPTHEHRERVRSACEVIEGNIRWTDGQPWLAFRRKVNQRSTLLSDYRLKVSGGPVDH